MLDMISIKSLLYMYNDNLLCLQKTKASQGIEVAFILMLEVYYTNVDIGSSQFFDTCNFGSSCYTKKQA